MLSETKTHIVMTSIQETYTYNMHDEDINNVSHTSKLAITQEMDIDISLPTQSQLNPITPPTHAKSTPKGKNKKKNKNKKVYVIDPDFADS
ncbi:hypothetical protein RCL_jg26085.t1 [Rhizophagus clarus]|uniref:Uncharacterized protein n=1 Tax=Rhizophagus clarus TaxID=94130 RepID=A0A8H3KSZ3_9GLOM|nr:hypothetical protein RCL_jg26085.t1 [Rhizophagus clarus]